MNIKKLVKCIGKAVMLAFYGLFRLLPIKRKWVFFESNLGRNYADSPRYISDELQKRGGYRIFWSFESGAPKGFEGKDIRILRRKSLRYFYVLARAGVWVSNCRMPQYLKKRKLQLYIQTWHGTPLKKLALDMTDVSMAGETGIEAYHRSFRENAKSWDVLVSQNPFSTETFRRCFDFEGRMLETGYPRNDMLFLRNDPASILEIKKRLGIPTDRPCILYAPTFRDDEANGSDTYRFSSALDFDRVYRELLTGEQGGKGYTLLVKYHYLVRDRLDCSKYDGRVMVFGEQTDIGELYLAADMLITDYSSVMFDYANLHRPMFFFCYDLEKYREKLRGFYFDFLHEAPGPVVTDTEALISSIRNYKSDEWHERYDAFAARYNTYDHGDASKKVADMITGGAVSKKKLLGYRVFGALYRLFCVLPVGKRNIYFVMTHDSSDEGNCGVMRRYIEEQYPDYRIHTLTRKDTEGGASGLLRFVFSSSFRLSRSSIVFADNGFLPLAFLRLRRSTKYIQLWHGTGTIKKFGQDSNEGLLYLLEKASGKNISMVTVSSEATRQMYAGCFGVPSERVLVTGLPRTDCLFEKDFASKSREKLESEYPELAGKRLVLYAPTFRDKTLGAENIRLDFDSLMDRLPKDMILGMRLHPFISESGAVPEHERIINFSKYSGINTLLGAADMLITDYSSIVFEYSALDRPMIFYAYDLEDFSESGRGFYRDYEEYVPGPVAHNEDELVSELFRADAFGEKRKAFFAETFAYSDGRSKERVLEEIM